MELSEYRRSKLIHYILTKQNKDGGFTILKGMLPSMSSETFYAVSILKMLKVEIPNKDKTINYLLDFQSAEGRYEGIFSAFYAVKTLSLFGLVPRNQKEAIETVLRYISRWKNIKEFYLGILSPLETIYYSAEILALLGYEKAFDEIQKIALRFLNGDGGFGIKNHSEIISTYFALAMLHSIGYSLQKPEKTIHFVKRCQNCGSVFAAAPGIYSLFIEDTYYGIKSLEFLGEKIEKPEKTFKFILGCQNSDGGFSRSASGGISTMENCFYTVNILNSINCMGK